MLSLDRRTGKVIGRLNSFDKSNKRLSIIGIILILLLQVGCSQSSDDEAQSNKNKTEKNKPTVELITVESIGKNYQVFASGFIRSPDQIELIAEVSGKVVSVGENLEPGQHVKQNEVLVQIEQETYRARVLQAEGALASAQTTFKNAETDLARYKRLAKENIAADVQLDQAKNQLATAQANLATAEAELTLAKESLEDTAISSPFDALIAEENVSVGMYVSSGQSLATVINDREVEVTVGIEDASAMAIKKALDKDDGKKAKLQIPNSSHTLPATQVYIAPVIDPQARTVNFKVMFQDISLQLNNILVGQYADVSFPAESEQDLYRAPTSAIRKNSYVFSVAENQTLKKHAVIVVRVHEDKALFYPEEHTQLDKILLTRLPNEGDGLEVEVSDSAKEI